MNKRCILSLFFLLAGTALADTFTLTDPFNQPGDSDVIGDKMKFDIERAVIMFDPSMVTVSIRMNYDNPSLDPFTLDCLKLNIGDVLFEVNGVARFGVALHSHGSGSSAVTGGHVYEINDPAHGVLTARDVLGDPHGWTYRPDELVWLNNRNGYLTDLGAGTVNVKQLQYDGHNGPKYEITTQFALPGDFPPAGSGMLAFRFAAATCANDVLKGNMVPEPGTIGLLGGGLLALAFARRRFARR